jgi:hypothetical protein
MSLRKNSITTTNNVDSNKFHYKKIKWNPYGIFFNVKRVFLP